MAAKKTTRTTRATVKMGKVRESFVTNIDGAKPRGVKAGKAVKGAITVGAATAVAGVGIAFGTIGGFLKGLVS